MMPFRAYALSRSDGYLIWNINLMVVGLLGDSFLMGCMFVGKAHANVQPRALVFLESQFGLWIFFVGGLILLAYLNWLIGCCVLRRIRER